MRSWFRSVVGGFGVLKCSSQVAGPMSDDATAQSTTGKVPLYASVMVCVGLWGLVLAVLNMFGMIHPTYHVSWGGLLTFEATNAAFGDARDGFHYEILGDTIFIAGCAGLIALGSKTINQQQPVVDWFRGLVINDTWTALNDTSVAGGQRTMAAWCLLLGLAFYLYFGFANQGWIDIGVYSVTIALMAAGVALNHASRVPPGDENID